MNCDNQCCENKHEHYINDRYGINVTAMAHTQEPLVVEKAAELVPDDMRKPGTKITFWTFDGWQTWQFQPMDVREWVLPESWVQDTEELKDIQNQIDSIQIGGWAISNQLGDDPHVGISQQALTELIGFDHVPDSIRGRIQVVEDEIGTDTTSDSLSGRITSLEGAVGTGGSVDARINQSKNQIIGNASSDYNTLGKTESKIREEVTRATATENTLNDKINLSVASLTGSVNIERNRALNAEELLRQAYEALTQSDIVVGSLPASGQETVIYRVPGNSSYKDYMWNGTQFVEMAEYDNAIDEEPIKNSNNVIKSGAIYKFMEEISTNSGEYKIAITDKYGNAVCVVDSQDKLKVFLDIVAETINGVSTAKIIQNNIFKIAYVDENENLIFGIDKDDKIVTELFDAGILYGTSDVYQKAEQDFCSRNKSTSQILINDSNYDYNPSYNQGEDLSQNTLKKKRLQLAVVTDTHTMYDTFRNGVDAANGFVTIDATVHLGDMCNWVDESSDTYLTTKSIIDSATKPLYITPGNHDVGTRTQYVKYCKDNVQLYNRFVKPAVDKGWLLGARPEYTYKKNGESVSFPKVSEYQENKVWYYHDFDAFKVRLIMLYPNDDGNVSNELDNSITDETSMFDRTYWKPVEYNASYDNLKKKQYYVGDYVNVEGYDTYSFECVQDVNVTLVTKSMGSYDVAFDYNPRFKALRRGQWYGQEQINWLCDRLEEAGEHEYTCVICQHYRFINIDSYSDTSTRFQNPYKLGGSIYEFRYGTEDKNIISQIVNAYQTGGSINKVLHANDGTYSGVDGGYDDTSAIPDVTLNKTFAHSGKVLFLHGHNHSDAIFRSNRYNQTDIGFISGTLYEVNPIDVNRENTTEGRDLVTCVTIHSIDDEYSYAHLTRVGNYMTNRIDENTNTLVSKLNEIIKF